MAWLLTVILALILLLVLSAKIRQKSVGIYKYALERSVHKQKNKQKILDLFQKNRELTNEQVRQALKISNRSVVRYMDELENMGKVKQLGDIGRGVSYQLVLS